MRRWSAAACAVALLGAQPAIVEAQAHHGGTRSRGSTMRSHGATGTTPLRAGGPPVLGAAGPPPIGAAGPPPLGAAGPPPLGAAGPPPINRGVVVPDPVRCPPGTDCGFEEGDSRAGSPDEDPSFEE